MKRSPHRLGSCFLRSSRDLILYVLQVLIAASLHVSYYHEALFMSHGELGAKPRIPFLSCHLKSLSRLRHLMPNASALLAPGSKPCWAGKIAPIRTHAY